MGDCFLIRTIYGWLLSKIGCPTLLKGLHHFLSVHNFFLLSQFLLLIFGLHSNYWGEICRSTSFFLEKVHFRLWCLSAMWMKRKNVKISKKRKRIISSSVWEQNYRTFFFFSFSFSHCSKMETILWTVQLFELNHPKRLPEFCNGMRESFKAFNSLLLLLLFFYLRIMWIEPTTL